MSQIRSTQTWSVKKTDRMRRGRVPELGLLLLGYQIFKNIGLTNIPPVTLLAILGQVGVYLQLV